MDEQTHMTGIVWLDSGYGVISVIFVRIIQLIAYFGGSQKTGYS